MNTVKIRNVEIGSGIPKICVPIVEVTREKILSSAADIIRIGADVVEWRADWYEDIFDFTKAEETLKELRKVLGETPLLFTFRTVKEGGEKQAAADIYVDLNIKIIETGYADLVDVEIFTGSETGGKNGPWARRESDCFQS